MVLKCNVCLSEVYSSHYVVYDPCGHGLCVECFEKSMGQALDKKRTLDCLICRRSIVQCFFLDRHIHFLSEFEEPECLKSYNYTISLEAVYVDLVSGNIFTHPEKKCLFQVLGDFRVFCNTEDTSKTAIVLIL